VLRTITTSGTVSGGVPTPSNLVIQDVAGHLLSCSDLARKRATAAVRIFAPPGNKPGGIVTVHTVKGDVVMNFLLLAMRQRSTHTVVFNGGACRSPGPQVGTAITLTADNAGSVKVDRKPEGLTFPTKTTVSINIHDSTASSRVQLCGEIAKGTGGSAK